MEDDMQGTQSKDGLIYFVAGFAGFIVATAVSASSGLPIAWASPMYFWFGWPLMSLVIYLIARMRPERPWRWTLCMVVGQVFSSIMYGNAAMVPVAMAYVTLLSVPQFAAGALGANASLRRRRTEKETSQEQDRL
jgi:hypothetical protein